MSCLTYLQKRLQSQCRQVRSPHECLAAFLRCCWFILSDFLQDIGPRYAGVLLGLTNTAGVLAGVISTAATGYILSVGTWNDVWTSAICFYVIGTIIWNLMATGEQIFD